jgi:hypothetical protein
MLKLPGSLDITSSAILVPFIFRNRYQLLAIYICFAWLGFVNLSDRKLIKDSVILSDEDTVASA